MVNWVCAKTGVDDIVRVVEVTGDPCTVPVAGAGALPSPQPVHKAITVNWNRHFLDTDKR